MQLKRPPRFLYKYRSLATKEQIRYTRQIILKNLIYFPNRNQLNDPFELKYILEKNKTEKEYLDILEIIGRNKGLSVAEALIFAKQQLDILNETSKEELISESYSRLSKEINSLGIFSLSEDNKNIPMWSYYADSHKGICIEFDLNAIPGLRENYKKHKRFVDVTYSTTPNIPIIDIGSNTPDIISKMSVKHINWKHEKEWRFLLFDHDEATPINAKYGLQSIKYSGIISSVIFGLRTSNTHKKMIQKWIKRVEKNDGHKIMLKQARAHNTQYKIVIDDLDE